jgi:hypothetical protein
MGRACSTHGEKRNASRVLMGKPERKRPLGIPRYRWECNIKINLIEICWGDMGWIGLSQEEGSCEHDNEPSGSIKCWKIFQWPSDWRLLKKGLAPWSS